MPGLNPNIDIHEIKTYPDAKPIRQRLCPIHPQKVAAIKAEVEKILREGFIYPIPLTDWVSNIVQLLRKKGLYEYVSIIGILIKYVQKTIILPPISTKLSIIVQEMKFSHLWLDFLDIIK